MSGRPARPAPSEALPRCERLRHRREFQSCYRRGRRHHGEYLILYAVANGLPHPRLGITASRKVGGAVARHQLKRRVKEIYRRWSGRSGLPVVDLVVHVRPGSGGTGFEPLRRDLERLLGKLSPPSGATR